jgi:hypothetical protein
LEQVEQAVVLAQEALVVIQHLIQTVLVVVDMVAVLLMAQPLVAMVVLAVAQEQTHQPQAVLAMLVHILQ